MLFNFKLRPVENITPWGRDNQLALHWFGLTGGWYWMDVGEDELFRYTDDILTLWEATANQSFENVYVDYQVVRFWEDLQDMLPYILEPIPNYILQRIQPGSKAIIWREKVGDFLLPENEDVLDTAYDTFDAVTSWLGQRWLHVGYLRKGPRIWFWCDDQKVYIHWDNTEVQIDGTQVWTATKGIFSLPIQKFIEEIQAFDQQLIDTMQTRVNAVCQHWSRPEIQINLQSLINEQEDRAKWMERALERVNHMSPTPWDNVLSMVERIDPKFITTNCDRV